MENIMESLNKKRMEIVAKIDEYNTALKAKNLARMIQIASDLDDLEDEYAGLKREEVFTKLRLEENPMKAAIIMRSYLIVSHKTVKKDGVVMGLEITTKKRDIDLVDFSESGGVPAIWKYKVEKFNQLLAIRVARDLKVSDKRIKEISTSFYMNRLAKEIDMGGTPDSNTAICKQLQMILDDVLFEDNGKGENIHRVINRDARYIAYTYGSRGENGTSVKVAKNSYMLKLVTDVFHRIVTGGIYDVDFKAIKKRKGNVPEVEEAKTEPETEEAKSDSKTEEAKTEPETETIVVEKA